MQAIVLTGASSGIGLATCQTFIKAGYHVFGSVRKPEDARKLQEQFGSTFHPLLFDVTDESALKAAALAVREALQGETLCGLVNNAGISLPAPLLYVPLADLRQLFEVNVTAVLMVTQAFAPLLGVDRRLRGKPGRIINIGSILGVNPLPYLGVYSATKAALEALTDVLSMELAIYGIEVSIIRPGPVATPIYDAALARLLPLVEKTDYGPLTARAQAFFDRGHQEALPPDRVAQVVLQAISCLKPRASYLLVAKLHTYFHLLLPKSVMQSILKSAFGFARALEGIPKDGKE